MTAPVVIVGAGAAGIAAARRLRDAGVAAVILEAGGRVGGRAYTIRCEGMALDLGCGWLHSGERNPWTGIAETEGLTVDRSKARWDVQWQGLGFPPADQAAFGAAFEAFDVEVERLARGPDVPLSAALPVAGEWAGGIDAVVGYLDGCCAADVSLHDHRAFDAVSSDNNWRVREGYGTAVAKAVAGLDVRLDAAVRTIGVTRDGVRVTGDFGTIDANHAIVTVSTGVVSSDAIRFDPPLPGKRDAAAALPLGHVGKVFLAVEGADELPIDGQLRGHPRAARSASHRLRPLGQPVIESYFGGPYARDLAAAGDAATADAMLGSRWRARLRSVAASAWHADPLVLGAWSAARPGHRAARARLAEPVADRLFFAGEACEPDDVGTAHGAHATGVRAAEAVLARLGMHARARTAMPGP